MKRNLIYLCVLALLMLNACKKDGLEVYNDETSKTSIYFPLAETTNDVITSFGYAKTNVADSTVSIIVRIIGAAASTDRPYNLSVADSTTLVEGTDYEFLDKPLRIKAGKVADTLKIKFHRSAKLALDSSFLYFDLKPNENFVTDYLFRTVTLNNVVYQKYYTRLKFRVDDIAGPPPFWTPGNTYYNSAFGLLGTFSTLKFQLLMTLYNLDINELIQPKWFSVRENSTKLRGYANGMKAYLDQMDLAGTPVYETDGTLMVMGKNAR